MKNDVLHNVLERNFDYEFFSENNDLLDFKYFT